MAVAAEEIASRLGDVLDGKVTDLRRLSGGASRTTSSFDLRRPDGTTRSLILQQDRGFLPDQGQRAHVEAALLAAARAAEVPVPGVVAAGVPDGLPAGWLVVERIEGESIPRKILRDPEWSEARTRLAAQCGRALAAIHGIDPAAIDGLPPRDPFDDPCSFLDALGQVRPALELGVRWLEVNRPPSRPPTTVHGDFRTGNLLIGHDGLRAVLDWELAHVGEAAEDVGWLCAPAWRFGGRGRVGGFGDLATLLEAYVAAGGEHLDERRVHWWEVYATVKWAVICALQASAHLSGAHPVDRTGRHRPAGLRERMGPLRLVGVAPAHDEPPPAIPPSPRLRSALRSPHTRGVGRSARRAPRDEWAVRADDRGSRFDSPDRRQRRRHGRPPAAAWARPSPTPTPDGWPGWGSTTTRRWWRPSAADASTTGGTSSEHHWPASARDQLLVANPSYLAWPIVTVDQT